MMRLEPAAIGHVWAHLLAQKAPPAAHVYSLLVEQTLRRAVWAGVEGGLPVVLGGVFVPAAELPGTAWLSVVPGIAPASVVRAALLMRRVVRAAAEQHAPGVVCVVSIEGRAGERLGRALGFQPTPVCVGPLREWKLEWPASAR